MKVWCVKFNNFNNLYVVASSANYALIKVETVSNDHDVDYLNDIRSISVHLEEVY